MLFSKKNVTVIQIVLLAVLIGCSKQYKLEWQQEEGYRWAEVDPGFFGSTGFEMHSSSRTNIRFRNDVSKELIDENRHYLNGSGVTVADIDGDGLQDIYFAAINGANRLYRNLGNFQFEDITRQAGVAHEEYTSTGVLFADVNGDRFPDLLITSLLDKNVLYINDGEGNFELKEDSGLGASNGAYSMAMADIDFDGDLDLYIANYRPRAVKDLFDEEELEIEKTVETINGKLQIREAFDKMYDLARINGSLVRVEKGTEDELFVNRGDGTYIQADPQQHFKNKMGDSIDLPADWGLTASFRDINEDSYPDLYVANDFWTPDRFWLNMGDGTFQLLGDNAVRNLSFSSMGVDFSDLNRDGNLDYMVTEMLSDRHSRRLQQVSQSRVTDNGIVMANRNSVYLNRGDTTYAQVAYYSGLAASGWSWATSFVDVDLDGFEDLLIANGYQYDYLDMETQFFMNENDRKGTLTLENILSYPSLELKNKAFHNNGDLTFSDVSTNWGFTEEDISQGMAMVDLDNDGDLDLAMNRFNERPAVYENKTTADRIAVVLKGKEPNTVGVGAKVKLTGDIKDQEKEIVAGGTYLSGSQNMVVFAAGNNTDYEIKVIWPNGEISTLEGAVPNRIYELDQSFAKPVDRQSESGQREQATFFEDVSERLNHTHHENSFDDESAQPLVPQKLSMQGPGVAWLDYDSDGYDDLLIGSGGGDKASMFKNTGDGQFTAVELGNLTREVAYDMTGITSWKEDDYTYVVVGNSIYENNVPATPSATLLLIGPDEGVQEVKIPRSGSSTGPLAAADIDDNGYVDLFIGGHFIPGRYPENAESRIILNDDGNFRLDQMNVHTFSKVGLVTGAVFTDYNGDHQPDLLLSTEWGSLRLFENNRGFFVEKTKEAGLTSYKGWWRGVATGDFNNDGRPDIIAANIGLNSYYQINDFYPLRLYYKDFNANGILSVIDSYYSEDIGGYVPRRRIHDFGSIPSLLKQVETYRDFATFSVSQIFGEDFSGLPRKEINTLKHMLFLNLPGGFQSVPLPDEAQLTAASHVGVLDFDNDGNEDLFMSQNFFALPEEADRVDAGRGLLLKGDGTGKLEPVDGSVSGIKFYGDQRGAALGDFNRDARTDIAISQNGGKTGLFLNRIEKRGIRVKLMGPGSNSDAIGSSIHLVYKNGDRGPVREIQAGSGYWSHNSKVQVLGSGGDADYIEVVWFDGTKERVEVEDDQLDYEISY